MKTFWRLVFAVLIVGAGIWIARADYAATLGSGANFASKVISSVHHLANLLCDATNGEANCAAVKAGNTAGTTDQAVVVSDPNVLAAVQAPPALGTSGGWTPKLLNNLTTTTTVKGSAGQLGMIHCWNSQAAVTYLQVFDISGAVTLGASTPVLSIGIPPTNSSGYTLSLVGAQFANAIKVAATTTATGASTAAMDCNAGYN